METADSVEVGAAGFSSFDWSQSESSTADPSHAREALEAAIERHDLVDVVGSHNGYVEHVARRISRDGAKQNVFGVHDVGLGNRKDLVDDAQQGFECRLDRVPAVDRDVSMHDLLKDFRIRDQAVAGCDVAFEHPLRIDLMWVRGADQVHRYVRVDQNHASARPRSISASIWSMSGAGKVWPAAARTAAIFPSRARSGRLCSACLSARLTHSATVKP
jgi:hypothetical protein